jgi:excisionase family DNA binding protein
VATQQKTNGPQVEKLLFKPREAATVIGASPSWVYARIEDGSIKSVRLAGRMVRIRREDLMSFIESSRVVA